MPAPRNITTVLTRSALCFQITTTFPKDPVYTFSISQSPFPIENRDVLGETQVRSGQMRAQ